MIQDALALDLWKLNSINVDKERGLAILGGGCIHEDVAKVLWDAGYMTTFPAGSKVGCEGRATLGGYGMLSGPLGLGTDQILGARLVTWEGKIVDTDEDEELLWALSGGGCGFGILTELRIRLHLRIKVWDFHSS
jgi:FAD/FMN-containing dehydrogenase